MAEIKDRNDKIVVIDPDKIDELQKELDELKKLSANRIPEVVKKIVTHGGGVIDPEKRYILLETGKYKTIEAGFKRLAAIPVESDKPKAPSNAPYLITIVIMMIIGILGVLGFLTVRPQENILVVSGIMFAIITPITTSIMAFMQSRDTNKAVNHRLDDFLRDAENAALAKGEKIGRREAEDRADILRTS